MVARRVSALYFLFVLGNGDAAAAEFEAPKGGRVEQFLPARPPLPERITSGEAERLGLPAGTPRAIADVWTEVRTLEPADRQTLASEFPQLKSIINPESEPAHSTTVEDLAKVADTERSAISQRADELRFNRSLSNYRDEVEKVIDEKRHAALSLVAQAIDDIPSDLILKPKMLREFLNARITTLALGEAKTYKRPYIFDPGTGKLTLRNEKTLRFGSFLQVKLAEVDVYKIVTQLVTLGVSAGVLCTTVTDCITKVAVAKSYLSNLLQHDKTVDVITSEGEKEAMDRYVARLQDDHRRARRAKVESQGLYDSQRRFDH